MLGCKLPDYRVNRAEALRYLGYAGQALDAEMEARIDENIAACEREARPGFVFRSFPIETCERGVRLAGSSLVLEGVDIARHLKGAAECAVLACTLGVANEAGMARRKAQSALDAAIYGAAGSSLVESVTDACEATVVADAAKRGMRTNWRYSPAMAICRLHFSQKSCVCLRPTNALAWWRRNRICSFPRKASQHSWACSMPMRSSTRLRA